MGFTVEKCCGCVDLRVGCVVIGIVQVVLALFSIVGPMVQGPSGTSIIPKSIIELPYAIFGSVALIFAAVDQDFGLHSSLQTKTIAILIYIGTRLRCIVFLSSSFIISALGALAGGFYVSAVISLISIILSIYFMLVAFSFYQELKEQGPNADVQDYVQIVQLV